MDGERIRSKESGKVNNWKNVRLHQPSRDLRDLSVLFPVEKIKNLRKMSQYDTHNRKKNTFRYVIGFRVRCLPAEKSIFQRERIYFVFYFEIGLSS